MHFPGLARPAPAQLAAVAEPEFIDTKFGLRSQKRLSGRPSVSSHLPCTPYFYFHDINLCTRPKSASASATRWLMPWLITSLSFDANLQALHSDSAHVMRMR